MKYNIPEITSPILCKNVHPVDTYSKNYSTLYQSQSSSLSNSNLPKSINSFSSMNNNFNLYSNRNNDCKSNSQKNIYYSQNKQNSNIPIDNYYDTSPVHNIFDPQSSYRDQLIQNNKLYYSLYNRRKNINNQLYKNENLNYYNDMENITNRSLFNNGNDNFGYDNINYSYQIGSGNNDQFNNELNVEMELMDMKLKLDLINQKVNKFNQIILPNTLKTIDDEVLFYQNRINRNKNLCQKSKNGYNNNNIINDDYRYYNNPYYRGQLQGQNNYNNFKYMDNKHNDDNLSDLADNLVDNLDNNYLSNDDTDDLIDEIFNFKNAIIENEKNEKLKYLQKKKEKKYAVEHSDKEKSNDNESEENKKEKQKSKNKKNKVLLKSKKIKIQNLKNRKNKKDNDSSPDSESENENEKMGNESASNEEADENINNNNFRLKSKRKKKIKEEIISVVDIPNMLSNEEKEDKASVANYNNIINTYNINDKLIDDKKEDIKEENKEEGKESSIKQDEINTNTNKNKELKGDINNSNTKDNNKNGKPVNTDEEDDLVIKEIISNTNKKLYEKLNLIENKEKENLNNDSQINTDNKNEKSHNNTDNLEQNQEKNIPISQNPPSESIPDPSQIPQKKVSFNDSLLITIQYDQKELITKLKIKNASNKQVPFHPHNMNKYINLLYSESPLKSCFTQKYLQSNPQKTTFSFPKKFRIRNNKDIIKRNIEMIKKIGERGCIYDVKNPLKKPKTASHIHCPHCKKFRDNPQKFFTEDLCPNVIKSYNLNVKKCMEKSKEELQRRNTYAEHYLTTVYKSGNDFNIFANKKEMEKIKKEEGDKDGKGYYTDTGELVCKDKRKKIFKGMMGIKDCEDDDMEAIEEEMGEEGEHNRKHSQ